MKIENRLASLERRCRLQFGVLVLFLGVLLLAAAKSPDAEPIRTTRVEIVDEDGKLRIVVGKGPSNAIGDESFGIAVFDAAGSLLTSLQADRYGSRFKLSDKHVNDKTDQVTSSDVAIAAWRDQPSIVFFANGKVQSQIPSKKK